MITATERNISCPCKTAKLYKMICDHIVSGFMIVKMIRDQNGNIIDYSHIEIDNSIFSCDNLKINNEKISKDMEDSWLQHYKEVAGSNKPKQFIFQIRSTNTWYKVDVFPSENKDIIGVIFENITELKDLSYRFERQAMMFRSAFSLSPAATLICNENGIIIDANLEAQKLFEISKEQLIGLECSHFTCKEDIQASVSAARKAKDEGAPQKLKKRCKTFKGKEICCDSVLNYIEDYIGNYYIIQLVDVTKKEEVKEKVLETLHELHEMVS